MLDTLVFLGCLAVLLRCRQGRRHLRLYALLAAGSCLLVTKDELVHKRLCSGGEQWLHAVQFILHPVVLIAAALLWLGLAGLPAAMVRAMLLVQVLLAAGFLALQAAFGRGGSRSGRPSTTASTTSWASAGTRPGTTRSPCSGPKPGCAPPGCWAS